MSISAPGARRLRDDVDEAGERDVEMGESDPEGEGGVGMEAGIRGEVEADADAEGEVDEGGSDGGEGDLTFPHIELDGLFPDEQIRTLHEMFWKLPDDYWEKNSDHGIEVKWRSKWKSEYDIP